MKSILLCLFSLILITQYPARTTKPEKKLLRQAQRFLDKGRLKDARHCFKKAVEKNPASYDANLGMGLLLSEMFSNYTDAQPFLEKAYDISKNDTVPSLIYALAKCYQHNGEFEKALDYFHLVEGYYIDPELEMDVQKDIKKRIGDCNYAIKNRSLQESKDLYIINAGRTINSDMPEYVPVLTPQRELIFTSRRKDDEREQLNHLDGKYFESMYIAKIEYNGFKEPRRYTMPDHYRQSKYQKNHESVVSMSPDGSILFTYHDGQIFEIKMEERASQKPKKLLKSVNFDHYQNHAYLSRDGKTLFFTSEGKGGKGGLDIYSAVKGDDGMWSKPENISEVNTEFEEDAPFLSEDGNTLYFASTGYDGYGNFDIYRSEKKDGKWGPPVNLGQPINSPGHDIYLVLDSKGNAGYFASSRNGGYGDMDIYKVNYLHNLDQHCTPGTDILSLSIEDKDPSDNKNTVKAALKGNFKTLASEWKINSETVIGEEFSLTHDYHQRGNYKVEAKFIVYCDTCFAPIVTCSEIINEFEDRQVLTSTATPVTVDLNKIKGELTREQLTLLGFDTRPLLFDFDMSELNDEAEEILKTNITVMKKHSMLHVEITGYTDAKGSETHNEKLSNKRAAAVRKHLVREGVPAAQILTTFGKGASEPVIDCGTGKDCDETAHKQNRRVVFKVYSK